MTERVGIIPNWVSIVLPYDKELGFSKVSIRVERP